MPPPDTPPSAPKLKRRWFRLSLRGLMILVLILGGGLGYVVHLARVQRDAVAAIRRAGNVTYNWQREAGGQWQGVEGRPPAPEWLVDWLGPDYFGHVAIVRMNRGSTDADLAQVARLGGLDSLTISGLEITDAGLNQIGNLSSLKELTISQAPRITSRGLAFLSRMPHLKRLWLTGLRVGDDAWSGLGGLKELEVLAISATGTTNAGLIHLRPLTSLISLGISENPITSAGLGNLAGFKDLEFLQLEKTRVADLAPVAGLTRLRQIVLTETPITDAGLAPVAHFPDISMLYLNKTSITDAGLIHLRNHKLCHELMLDETRVTDAGVASLATLSGLKMLNLSKTALCDAGLDRILTTLTLNRLDVAETNVTDAGLDHFQSPGMHFLNLDRTRVTLKGISRLRLASPSTAVSHQP